MFAVQQSDRQGSPLCVLVADDLTGACDAGVWFARKGMRTRVTLGSTPAPESDVLVVSTDSRSLPAAEAAEQVRRMAGRLPLLCAQLVFKKIDSTFRGQIAAECDALMQLAGRAFGVIAPAVPSQGRIVQDGVLSVQDISGRWRLDIREVLREQDAAAATVSPGQFNTAHDLATRIMQISASARYVLCDSANEKELAMAAEAILSIQSRPLCIGASGLARHVAALLGSSGEHATMRELSPATGPVVLCVGSNHAVTLAQLEHLQQGHGSRMLKLDGSAAGQIGRAAEAASHLVLMIDTSSASLEELRMFLEEIQRCSPAAILMTGGDTAAALCRAGEAEHFVLEEEVVAGVPVGYLEGGLLDGVRVATKSGGFGGRDCLLECIRRLSNNAMTGAR